MLTYSLPLAATRWVRCAVICACSSESSATPECGAVMRNLNYLGWLAMCIVLVTVADATVAQQKLLILHDLAGPYATPSYLNTNHAYLDTLPLDGFAVYASDGTSMSVLQPNPVSLATYQSYFGPLSGLTWTTAKHSLATMYYGTGWADIYDDAKWAIVAQNAANYAQAIRAAGLEGVIMDNENYDHYGTYGNPTCGSPHTQAECQAKMVARGNQVMTAMISQFPTINVVFLIDATLSDNTFWEQPWVSSNNIAFANTLVGPFEAGFVQATQGTSALLYQGGENAGTTSGLGAWTSTDFNNLYKYNKNGMANDTLACAVHGCDTQSRAAGPNGFIPSALRPVWPNLVQQGFSIYDMIHINCPGGKCSSNVAPLKTLSSAITNALNQSDKWVWMYMEVWCNGCNHPTMMIPPGSAANAVSQAYLNAVHAGRAALANSNDIRSGASTNPGRPSPGLNVSGSDR